MAVDDNGIDPTATDGEPSPENQLAAARARREAEADASDQEAIDAMNGKTGKRGRAVDDEPDPPVDEDGQTEMFANGSVEGDSKVTHRNIIKAGMAVKVSAKLSNAAVPMTQGLYAFGYRGEVLVTFEAGRFTPSPQFGEEQADGSRKVTGVNIAQDLRAVHVRSATDMLTVEQVLDILEQKFGIPRSADKVAEVFGPQTPEQRSKAATG